VLCKPGCTDDAVRIRACPPATEFLKKPIDRAERVGGVVLTLAPQANAAAGARRARPRPVR